jgi:hypothetical protein
VCSLNFTRAPLSRNEGKLNRRAIPCCQLSCSLHRWERRSAESDQSWEMHKGVWQATHRDPIAMQREFVSRAKGGRVGVRVDDAQVISSE